MNPVKRRFAIGLKRNPIPARRVGSGRTEASPQGEQAVAGGQADPGKGSGLVRDQSQRTVDEVRAIYQFMQANQAPQIFTITAMCRVFRINRRAYYEWRQRQPVRDAQVGHEEHAMKRELRTLHSQHRGLYGVNRLTVRMKLWYPKLGRRRIYRFMKELGIRGKTRRRSWRITVPDHRPHGIQDHVQRDLQASKPQQLVVCDATAIPLRGDVAYLAVVLHVYSPKIVGWALDRTQSAQLMIDALRQVIARGPTEIMICHSD